MAGGNEASTAEAVFLLSWWVKALRERGGRVRIGKGGDLVPDLGGEELVVYVDAWLDDELYTQLADFRKYPAHDASEPGLEDLQLG